MRLLTISLLVLYHFCESSTSISYYELLGVPKDANSQEIRKAFKKLAVSLHPDKNPDDENAHEQFIKLTKAYEVLKDAELRKKYDLFGEDGMSGSSNFQPKYHSYTYYRDNFGIYDDDSNIITLNKADFDQSVLNSNDLWFINFYSPMCSHCHTLAPEWRALANEMEGALRIGAVNCEDEWELCRVLNIRSYPSLFLYPHRERYNGARTFQEMRQFVLDRFNVQITYIQKSQWNDLKMSGQHSAMSWLLFLCGGKQSDECPLHETRLKVGAMLNDLVGVGSVDCDGDADWCFEISPEGANIVFWERTGGLESSEGQFHDIKSLDALEITKLVFDLLPSPTDLDGEAFDDLLTQLSSESASPWLVYFYIGSESAQAKELKKLPALLPLMRIGRVHCGRNAELCSKWHVVRYPLIAVLKQGGSSEVYHGREMAPDIANFAKESSTAINLDTLSPNNFPEVLSKSSGNKTAWFVDFYAPWCPPCMRLLPEFRKASREFEDTVHFGTIDCTIHVNLCRQYNVRSYPTTIFFNESKVELFKGSHSSSDIVDFIQEMLSPRVKKLSEVEFYDIVGSKKPSELWIIDFFAPWCGACQILAPQWRKLAKTVSSIPNVHIGEVDCAAESALCSYQGVTSYPTIRLYPFKSSGLSTVAMYSGYHRDASSLRAWLFSFLPSAVVELNQENFERQVLHSSIPWLIDFYAPWCGHCQVFAPEFQLLATRLEGRVKCGKLNCEASPDICRRAYVRGYPTVMFYYPNTMYSDQGEEIESQSADRILQYVERVLPSVGIGPPHDEL